MLRRPDSLRLLADDLTGALDSASAFVRLFGPLDVGLDGEDASVLDSATRECDAITATARVAALARNLAPAPGRLVFFKVDSLLRGHAGAELATILLCNRYAHVLIAPAMPFQGRITREGRQHLLRDGAFQPTGEDIAATLRAAGVSLRISPPDAPLEPGVTLFNAETEADLDRIAAAGLAAPGSVLFVGTGGLCAALTRVIGVTQKADLPALHGPLLGLIGTDHPVMLAQAGRLPQCQMTITAGDAADAHAVTNRLHAEGAALVSCALPEGLSRITARTCIERIFADLVSHLPPPGCLFVSGGETLRTLLPALGARSLRVSGEIEPGLPLSRLIGGRWDGLAILSKSGAFGTPSLLETCLGLIRGEKKAS